MADSESVISDEHTVSHLLSAWSMLKSMDFMAIEIQIVLSAVGIIYVGAHASLRRPPSAAPPVEKRKKKGGKAATEDKEEFASGFEASDAIVLPLIAATVLIGLYYLIKWLQNPAILNKILRWHMSMTGVFSTGLFLGNMLQLALGFVYPDYWADGEGRLFNIDARSRSQKLIKSSGDAAEALHEPNPKKHAPFPGFASTLSLSPRMRKSLYTIRHLLMEDWNMELNLGGLVKETAAFKLTTLIGLVLGFLVQGIYLYTSSFQLANVIGLAVCYFACQYMSVTSYLIGSLVLVGLFVYDIVMVFYTPFMVGVATQIDVPIKLTYETANRSSILGLGDIVLPGIFICLALRFDLWKHYQRQITKQKIDLKTITKPDVGADALAAATTTTAGAQEVTTVETAYRDVKVPFVDPRGQWGNTFWTTSWRDMVSGKSAVQSIADSSFPKTYFHATIFGYLLGMVTTVAVLLIFRHGQPALLYLVPGVVGSAYLTGWWRGELKDMLTYTEDGSLDTEDVVVEVDGEGNVIPKPKGIDGEKAVEFADTDESKEASAKDKEGNAHKAGDKPYEVLHFSITVPREEDGLKED